jgi:hypothetical protein
MKTHLLRSHSENNILKSTMNLDLKKLITDQKFDETSKKFFN